MAKIRIVRRITLQPKSEHAEGIRPVPIAPAVVLADARQTNVSNDVGSGAGCEGSESGRKFSESPACEEIVVRIENVTDNHEQRDSSSDVPDRATAPPTRKRKRADLGTFYPIRKILGHRMYTTGAVDLLVHWDGKWRSHPPTWQSETALWEDCREAVSEYWCPDGRCNTRTTRLGLDPYDGPFTVGRILGKKRARKGVTGKKGKVRYLIEYVGYEEPMWQPSDCIPAKDIARWHANK